MLKQLLLLEKNYEYYSNSDIETIKNLITKIPDKNETLKVTDLDRIHNTFKIAANWNNGRIINFEYKEAYLEGKLITETNNTTKLVFNIRPNSIYPIFFYLLAVFFILCCLGINHNKQNDTFLTAIPLLFMAFVFWIIGKYNTMRLLGGLIKELDLYKK